MALSKLCESFYEPLKSGRIAARNVNVRFLYVMKHATFLVDVTTLEKTSGDANERRLQDTKWAKFRVPVK